MFQSHIFHSLPPVPTDPLGGVEGCAVPPQEPYPVRSLRSLSLTLQLFGPLVTDPPVTD